MRNALSSIFAQRPTHYIGPFGFCDVLAQIRNPEGSEFDQIKIQHFHLEKSSVFTLKIAERILNSSSRERGD
jgi:hypothetical protein